MKILVTGSAGFIGFHLTKKLLLDKHEVVGIDNINDYYSVDLKYDRLKELGIEKTKIKYNQYILSKKYNNFKFIKQNLEDLQKILKTFKDTKFDIVCHLAAQAGVRYSIEQPHKYINSNIVGFLNILEGCRNAKIKNFIFASSSSVYGLNESQPFKTSDLTEHPVSLYAATKKSNEMMAHSYSHLYNIPTTALRFFTVYGAWGRPDMAPALFANALFHNNKIKVFNYGNMSRDFTYIDDIVDGICKVIHNPAVKNKRWNPKEPEINSSSAPYKIYNIGNGKPIKLMQFIDTLQEIAQKKAILEMLPMQDGDVVSTFADISDMISDFNYQPKTTLESGITEFIKWYRSYYKV